MVIITLIFQMAKPRLADGVTDSNLQWVCQMSEVPSLDNPMLLLSVYPPKRLFL